MSTRARKERKALQRNLRLFGQRSAAAALWEPEPKVPTGHHEKAYMGLPQIDTESAKMARGLALAAWARGLA